MSQVPVVGAVARRRPAAGEKQREKSKRKSKQTTEQTKTTQQEGDKNKQHTTNETHETTETERRVGKGVRRRRRLRRTGPNQHLPHPHVADEKDAGQGPENPPEGSIFGTRGRRERLSGEAGTPMEWRVSTRVRGGRGRGRRQGESVGRVPIGAQLRGDLSAAVSTARTVVHAPLSGTARRRERRVA